MYAVQKLRMGSGYSKMKAIKTEAERQERIKQVRRQLGSPKTSPMKRRDLNKYLNKLLYMRIVDASDTYTAGHNERDTEVTE